MKYMDLRSKDGVLRYSVSKQFMLDMMEKVAGKWKTISVNRKKKVVYEFKETQGITISGEIYLPVFVGDYLDVNGEN